MQRSVRIPARAEGRIFVVLARVGEADARLVVDTGAGTSALSLACGNRLQLQVLEHLRVRTPTGLTAVGTYMVPSLSIGELKTTNLRLAAVPLRSDNVDGLLGLDFFRAIGATAITLDLASGHVEVRL